MKSEDERDIPEVRIAGRETISSPKHSISMTEWHGISSNMV
jgi:hypothetical protein